MHAEQGYALSVSEQMGGSDRPGALGMEGMLQRCYLSAVWGSQENGTPNVGWWWLAGGLVT